MLSHRLSKKHLSAVIFATSAVLVVGFPAGSVESAEAVLSVGNATPDDVAFYKPYDVPEKIVYWMGNAVAREVTQQAQIGYLVPVEAIGNQGDFETLSKWRNAAICFKPKDQEYYVVMDRETASRHLGTSDINLIKATLGGKLEDVGLMIPEDNFTSEGWADQLRTENIEWRKFISWKPKENSLNAQSARTEPRIKALIEEGIVRADPRGIKHPDLRFYKAISLPREGNL